MGLGPLHPMGSAPHGPPAAGDPRIIITPSLPSMPLHARLQARSTHMHVLHASCRPTGIHRQALPQHSRHKHTLHLPCRTSATRRSACLSLHAVHAHRCACMYPPHLAPANYLQRNPRMRRLRLQRPQQRVGGASQRSVPSWKVCVRVLERKQLCSAAEQPL
jgi:hypothetical protein